MIRLLTRQPALQWHYRILQALALDEDLPEKPEDKTIPKYKQIDKVGSEVAAFPLSQGRPLISFPSAPANTY